MQSLSFQIHDVIFLIENDPFSITLPQKHKIIQIKNNGNLVITNQWLRLEQEEKEEENKNKIKEKQYKWIVSQSVNGQFIFQLQNDQEKSILHLIMKCPRNIGNDSLSSLKKRKITSL